MNPTLTPPPLPFPSGPLPTLAVPALGLPEAAVLDSLGLTWREVYPLYGHEIGAPRDYVYRRAGTIFTAQGVRRIVAHFGYAIVVLEEKPDRALCPICAQPRKPNYENENTRT